MAIDIDVLRSEVGATPESDDTLTTVLAASEVLLDKYVAENANDADTVVPPEVYDEALLAMAVDMFNRHQAPNGVLNQQFGSVDGVATTPIRIGSDPLRPARALLAMWCTEVAFG